MKDAFSAVVRGLFYVNEMKLAHSSGMILNQRGFKIDFYIILRNRWRNHVKFGSANCDLLAPFGFSFCNVEMSVV